MSVESVQSKEACLCDCWGSVHELNGFKSSLTNLPSGRPRNNVNLDVT